jgi:tripartite-type tricarboxylate transporter receptor subunit TctC
LAAVNVLLLGVLHETCSQTISLSRDGRRRIAGISPHCRSAGFPDASGALDRAAQCWECGRHLGPPACDEDERKLGPAGGVENRSGAGTTIGTNAVAKAAPDGHTLLVNSAAFAASAAIYAKLAYDPLKDFAPVSQVAIAPIVVAAAPSLGVGSIKELVELAKRKPGQLKFGSAGVGSSTHFAGEQFKLAAGLSVVHVAYKGPPEALLDTMTGRIEYCLSPVLPALPFIRDGKLLAFAVTTAQRSPLLQDVPTVAEAGVPNYEYQDWWGVFAPAATPVAVIDKIGKEIARVLELSDVKQQVLNQGAEARPSPPADFTTFVRAKVETARQAAASANIRAD